ncbi:MAG: hypothetical protein K0R43_596 [Pseudoduganella sp.]|nr:hypothetical protein [Pseudoduganella sp.]
MLLARALPSYPPPAALNDAEALDSTAIQTHLGWILNNDLFRKAPRLSRLLRFLVDCWLHGAERDTTEYGIGIEVFDRNPASYSTGEDPIVRVQVGRLREKLRAYYAGPGRHDGIVIAIPIRSYMPLIRRRGNRPQEHEPGYVLAFYALRSVSAAPAGALFTQGLTEELSHHLFRSFGDRVLFHQCLPPAGAPWPDSADFRLEGSIRIDDSLVRAAVRLTNTESGALVWSEQLDRHGAPGIAMQEDLARTISGALGEYLAP